MKTFIISYDLINPGKNYDALLQKIKNFPRWARLGGSAYLVLSDKSVVEVRDHLVAALDTNDRLFVGTCPVPSAWRGLPDEVSKWILENQPNNS